MQASPVCPLDGVLSLRQPRYEGGGPLLLTVVYGVLEHHGQNNPSVSDLEWSAPVRPLERFGHCSVEVLNERQDLLPEILYRDEIAPL